MRHLFSRTPRGVSHLTRLGSRRSRYGASAVLLAVPVTLAAVILPGHAASGAGASRAAGASAGTHAAPTVNWALDGTATATTAESAKPASNAIDGDAGTNWCTSGWTG